MDLTDDSVLNLIAVSWDRTSWTIGITVSFWFGLFIFAIFAVGLALRSRQGFSFTKFEIDQAEFGVGNSKFSFRPNLTDRQVAYAIWVELSTRKIGLPIDLDHDVISEIYDSWHAFFLITRDLLKEVPISKVKQKSTQAIINLSIEVLNEGLRPHLTHWQARFRHWYERELKKHDAKSAHDVIEPQKIQSEFPRYNELKDDLLKVNQSLMRYRAKMRELVMNA